MKTFERYFIKDYSIIHESVNPYFDMRHLDKVVDLILTEFGVSTTKGRIVNGHIPLDCSEGDAVVLAQKGLYLIDGGMGDEYSTKIGGYTLISDSWSYVLVSNDKFGVHQDLVEKELDIIHTVRSEDIISRRTFIYDTDIGSMYMDKIADLSELIENYRSGKIKERVKTNKY